MAHSRAASSPCVEECAGESTPPDQALQVGCTQRLAARRGRTRLPPSRRLAAAAPPPDPALEKKPVLHPFPFAHAEPPAVWSVVMKKRARRCLAAGAVGGPVLARRAPLQVGGVRLPCMFCFSQLFSLAWLAQRSSQLSPSAPSCAVLHSCHTREPPACAEQLCETSCARPNPA